MFIERENSKVPQSSSVNSYNSSNSKAKRANSNKTHSNNNASNDNGESGSASCQSSSESGSSESSLDMPRAPDGGLGWVIVFASFFCHMIADGTAFSFGVLFVELLDYFQESKSKTAWIGSVFVGVPMICGPLSSALTTRYGCRKVTIIGGILTTVGFLASAFVTSVDMLCLTFGVVAGFGLSLVYVPAVVIVAFYFEKKRAFATGLAVCGSGIGTAVFALLTEHLIKQYGWRGTILILSGIQANLIICGALFRPLEFTREEKHQRALETFNKLNSPSSHKLGTCRPNANHHDHDPLSQIMALLEEPVSHSTMQLPTYLTSHSNSYNGNVVESLPELHGNNNTLRQMIQSYYCMNINNAAPATIDPNIALLIHSQDSLMLNGHMIQSSTTMCNSNAVIDPDTMLSFPTNYNQKKEVVWHRQRPSRRRRPFNTGSINPTCIQHPFTRKDIFYRGNLLKLTGIALTAGKTRSCPDLHLPTNGEDDSSDDSSDDSALFGGCHMLNVSKSMRQLLREMISIRVLTNPMFLIFTLSNFVLYFWYDVPYVFLVDRVTEDLGVSDKSASLLVTIMGMVNTVGQVMYGFVGDRQQVNVTLLYSISIMLCGIAILLVPIFNTYIPMAIIAAMFGLFISANYSLSTIMLVDFVGMNRLTNAYGILMMIQGIANLIGPPIAGLMSDISGTYDNSFYGAGAFIALSGSMMLLCLVLKYYQSRQDDKESLAGHSVNDLSLTINDSDATAGGSKEYITQPLVTSAASCEEKLLVVEIETVL